MSSERVYTLAEPVQFGSELVEHVTITKKLKFLRGQTLRASVGKSEEVTIHFDFGTIMDVAAKMIAQVPAFLDELGDEDRATIMGEAQSFLFSNLGTGPTG